MMKNKIKPRKRQVLFETVSGEKGIFEVNYMMDGTISLSIVIDNENTKGEMPEKDRRDAGTDH